MSKFIFGLEDEFTTDDGVALFLAWENLVEKSANDQGFHRKHHTYIWFSRVVVQTVGSKKCSKEDRLKFQKQIMDILSHGRGYFSAQIYFGMKMRAEKLYRLYVKTRFPKKFKPKQFVGVGYDDHGTAGNDAYDGSPHWTEVASDEEQIAQWTSSRTEKVDNMFSAMTIHNQQQVGWKPSPRSIKNAQRGN